MQQGREAGCTVLLKGGQAHVVEDSIHLKKRHVHFLWAEWQEAGVHTGVCAVERCMVNSIFS